jgi:hypothetical protein
MPIRFRCVYCDKLLGIAKRKAGAVVNCPQCGQPLIVPTPEPEPEPQVTAAPSRPAAPAGPEVPVPDRLFERDDFDVLLEPDATFRTPEAPPARKRPKPAPPPEPERPMAPQPFAVERRLPQPPPGFPTVPPVAARMPATTGIVISSGMLILALIAILGLIGLAFGGGVLVGRMINAGG